MAIAKFISFSDGSKVLDLGTGGGFPGIPLSIVFPECKFTLIDGTRKKISVVQDVIKQLKISNAQAHHQRAEEHKQKHDFIVIRAVATIDKLVGFANPLIKESHQNPIPNGILALKGGDLDKELSTIKNTYWDKVAITDLYDASYFPDKYLVYVQA